jgi:hypothetical protein
MRYYVWIGKDHTLVSKAWPYDDETERMVEETRPPAHDAVLRTGTKEQLKTMYGLDDQDFVDIKTRDRSY